MCWRKDTCTCSTVLTMSNCVELAMHEVCAKCMQSKHCAECAGCSVEEYAVSSVWSMQCVWSSMQYVVCGVSSMQCVWRSMQFIVCGGVCSPCVWSMQYVVWRSMQYAVCVQEECGGLTTGSGSRLPPQLYLLLAQLLGHLNILSFCPVFLRQS